MAFVPKEWKARLVEFAGRRTLTNVSTGETAVYDVARNEGTVSQEGDAFSAANMNDLETRISTEFGEINKNMGGCVLSTESDGAYVTYTQNGETVKKKLGSGEIKRTQIASGRLGRQDGTNHSITASAVNIEGYESMTADNFSIELGSITGRTSGGTNCNVEITKSYNASTGTLTVSVSHSGSDGLAFVSATIYCYHNE